MDNLMRRLECGSESAEEWKSCCLAQFSDFLGMSTTSFEKEILALLKKWKLRKEQKDQWSRSKRIKVESSRFERELGRLECSINFKSLGSRSVLSLESMVQFLWVNEV